MPIKVIVAGESSLTHVGEVVEVKRFKAQRNLSDTLDYSDYQTVNVTEALVWQGRTKEVFDHVQGKMVKVERPITERFAWVDCSNLFVWRGADHLEPSVDAFRFPDVVVDYLDYLVAQEDIAAKALAARAEREKAEQIAREQKERDRPVVGKRMRVVSGRKVKPGTEGIVAYVWKGDRGDRVLLKDEETWRDRKAPGTWVDARHVRAAQ